MIAKNSVFTPQTPLSEMLERNHNLTEVFSRLGLGLGFGESTVEEAARSSGLDPQTVCLICNVYTFEAYQPDVRALSQGRITDVVRYIQASHRSYLTTELVWLESALRDLITPYGEKQQKVIWRFFNDYKDELEKHFAYEEELVIPYIRDLLFGRSTRGFTPEASTENHNNIQEKLSDLRNLVMKTLPRGDNETLRFQILRFLFHLESDLKSHTLVEERILIPMTGYLEHPQAVRAADQDETPQQEVLTEREKEILVSVAKGMLNKEIADAFNISIHTVISHRKNITRKTGIKTVAGLTVYALLSGLIDINTIE